jgi:23S rRNA pseudoU1915 N3-methylase RlmH
MFPLTCASDTHKLLAMTRKELREYFKRMSKKAAKARMAKISPEERSRLASLAAKARWRSRPKGTK